MSNSVSPVTPEKSMRSNLFIARCPPQSRAAATGPDLRSDLRDGASDRLQGDAFI